MSRDQIEFYVAGSFLARVGSSHAPDRGDLVNIRRATYRVIGRTYVVDQSSDAHLAAVCCVINLEPAPDVQPRF